MTPTGTQTDPLAAALEQAVPVLEPSPRLTVSEWADENRVLHPKTTAEPGAWRTARVPYIREPMDSGNDPTVSQVTILKSARTAGSECMNNVLLASLDNDPGPSMFVLPTESDAKDEATGRLRRMIEDCEATRRHIPYANFARGDQISLRGPRDIYMAAAAAPRTLVRKTIRRVFFDELDNCDEAGGKLGNHLELVGERVTTFGYRSLVFSVSTPTTYDGAAWTAFCESDERHYYVPCPRCGEYQVFVFENIKWPSRDELGGDLAVHRQADLIEHDNLAWYECKHCSGRIEQDERAWMVDRGVWIPEAQKPDEALPLNCPEIVALAAEVHSERWTPKLKGEKPRTRRIGFQIWSAYSPWRTFSMIAAKFLKVKADPERLRVFVNSWLGQPFSDEIESSDSDDIKEKKSDGPPRDQVPGWVTRLAMGVDVQRGHFYYIVRGWGPGRRSVLIREGTCTTFDDVYEVFDASYAKEGGGWAKALVCAIDSGDNTKDVYDFVRTHPGVVPVKGYGDRDWSVHPKKVEYQRPGKKRKRSVTLYSINTHFYKDVLGRLMRVAPGDPGHWGVHRDVSDDYCKQVVAEHKVRVWRKVNGRKVEQFVWVTKSQHQKNHYWDCEVYAMAMADHRGWLNLAPKTTKRKARRRSAPTDKRSYLDRMREARTHRR